MTFNHEWVITVYKEWSSTSIYSTQTTHSTIEKDSLSFHLSLNNNVSLHDADSPRNSLNISCLRSRKPKCNESVDMLSFFVVNFLISTGYNSNEKNKRTRRIKRNLKLLKHLIREHVKQCRPQNNLAIKKN